MSSARLPSARRRGGVVLGVLVAFGVAGSGGVARSAPPSEPPAAASPAADPTSPPAAEAPVVAPADAEAPVSNPDLLDATLPSGLRVLVARDDSLPVAAVVLAIETGTRDDPPQREGLHHALAYQLQQGNRELRPEAILDAVHARGGLATMAVGSAQVRFASLVPASFLDRVLALELSRLRAPSIDERRWRQSVGRARSDRRPGVAVPGEAMAAVWGEESLAQDGRRPAKTLRELEPLDVAEALRRDFHYANATLTVVSPEAPAEVLARIEALAADLPARPRAVDARSTEPPPSATVGARPVPVKGGKGRTFVWAVPGHTEAIFSARVVCGVLNRQKPLPAEAHTGAGAKVRCVMHEDPRRPAMSVRIDADGPAAAATLSARLRRIADALGSNDPAPTADVAAVEAETATASGNDEPASSPEPAANVDDTPALLEAQRERQSRALLRVSSSPLGLARILTFSRPRGPASGTSPRALRVVTGAASLSDPAGLSRVVPHLLSIDAAVRLVEGPAKPPTPDGSETSGDDASPLDEDEPDPDAARGEDVR